MITRLFVFALLAMLFAPVFGQTYEEYLLNRRSGETFEQYTARVKRERRTNNAVNFIGTVIDETKKAEAAKKAKEKSFAIYPVKAPEAVDLGLPSGVLWGSCNLGATKPEDGGNRYAWGETKPKRTFTRSNYKYCTPEKVIKSGGGKDADGFDIPVKETKIPETWTDIGRDIAGTKYDAARVALGEKWRMPSKYYFQELIDNCSKERTTKNNVEGIKFTGPNGKWIFLPNVEVQYYDTYYEHGYYWASSYAGNFGPTEGSSQAYFFNVGSLSGYLRTERCDAGCPIRPIYVDSVMIAEHKKKFAEEKFKELERKKKAVSDLISDVQNQISPYELEITKKYPDRRDVSVVDKCVEKMKTVNSEYCSKDWYAMKDKLNALSLVLDYKYFDKSLTDDQRDNIIIKNAKEISGYDGKSTSGNRNFLQILKNLKKIALDKKEMTETRFFLLNALLLESTMHGVPSDSYVNELFELFGYCQDLEKFALYTWAPDLQELVEWAEPSITAEQNRDLYSLLATIHEKAGNKKIAKKIRREKLGLK